VYLENTVGFLQNPPLVWRQIHHTVGTRIQNIKATSDVVYVINLHVFHGRRQQGKKEK